MRSLTTVNEEKDRKGLLKPLTYKEKYLIYYKWGLENSQSQKENQPNKPINMFNPSKEGVKMVKLKSQKSNKDENPYQDNSYNFEKYS